MTAAPATTATTAAYFDRFEKIDFIACGDGWLSVRIGRELTVGDQRLRRQRRGMCGGRERDAACRKSKGEFQKVPALHDISLLCDRSN